MRTKYRVKVRRGRLSAWWLFVCDSCVRWDYAVSQQEAHRLATNHAATCEALHRANWAAACPSCKLYGRIAKACPICLGYGFEREREGLE